MTHSPPVPAPRTRPSALRSRRTAGPAEQAVTRLERLPADHWTRHGADEAAARLRILDWEIDGALVMDPAGTDA